MRTVISDPTCRSQSATDQPSQTQRHHNQATMEYALRKRVLSRNPTAPQGFVEVNKGTMTHPMPIPSSAPFITGSSMPTGGFQPLRRSAPVVALPITPKPPASTLANPPIMPYIPLYNSPCHRCGAPFIGPQRVFFDPLRLHFICVVCAFNEHQLMISEMHRVQQHQQFQRMTELFATAEIQPTSQQEPEPVADEPPLAANFTDEAEDG